MITSTNTTDFKSQIEPNMSIATASVSPAPKHQPKKQSDIFRLFAIQLGLSSFGLIAAIMLAQFSLTCRQKVEVFSALALFNLAVVNFTIGQSKKMLENETTNRNTFS